MARLVNQRAHGRTVGDDQTPKDRKLNAAFWKQFGGDNDPPMRDKILFVTMDDVARVGPSTFNVGHVCSALGISNSLINHHFGGRDELIAEATVFAYARYVDRIWLAAMTKASPEARLRTWIESAVEAQSKMQGLAAIMNYPTASLDVTNVIVDRYATQMEQLAALNMGRLFQLVSDVRHDRVTPDRLVLGEVTSKDLIGNPKIAIAGASIGWSILGLAVWKTGPHLPSARAKETAMLLGAVTKHHIDKLIAEARGK